MGQNSLVGVLVILLVSVMDSHEMYPNPPLALVAVEVRFPGTLGTDSGTLPMTLQRAIRNALGTNWVIQPIKAQRLSVSVGPTGASQSLAESVVIPRFTVRDGTLAVAITDNSVAIETTKYRHYPEFRQTLGTVLTATADLLSPDGVVRVGMRYIDEVRIPGMEADGVPQWAEWLDSSLLSPQFRDMAQSGFLPTGWEGVAQYRTGSDKTLVLRHGPRVASGVASASGLKRPSPPAAGPFYLLDFDSFWEPAVIEEFKSTEIVAICDELRRPVRTLFDLLLTEKLLQEFKREHVPR